MSEIINDNDLIHEIKKGNTRSFQSFVEKYEDNVANVCVGLLGNTPEAEEVAQEVFIKFYYKIGNFRQDSTVKTYLTRIAINLSLNELKKRKRNRERYISREDLSRVNEAESVEPDIELNELIEKALQMIDTPLRAIIILRLMEGYSTKETAKILKIPQGTVLSRLFRAQEQLRQILKDFR